MILSDSTEEFVALMPLAKWLSKRFNLPLKRNEKPPTKSGTNNLKSNGLRDSKEQVSSQGKAAGKIPKVRQEQIVSIGKSEPAAESLTAIDTEAVDDISFYSNVEALKKRATTNKAFVSTDAEENADITDEAWNQLKSLKSDTDRMSHAMRKFGNKIAGEPNRNMTIHGYRRCNLGKKDEAWKKARDESKANPMFYEYRNRNIYQLKEGKIETVFTNQEDPDIGSKKRKAGEHEETPSAKRPKLVKFEDYEKKMIEALVTYKKPKLGDVKDRNNDTLRNRYWRYYLRHFKNSIEETKTFFQYYGKYKDQENKLLMTHSELKADQCAEMIFSQFAVEYGHNPVVRCKDCEEVDKTMGKEVMHPY